MPQQFTSIITVFFTGLLLIVAAFVSAPTADAQQTTINVSPAIIESANNPGDSFKRVITIKNGGDLALPVSIKTQSFLDSDNHNLRKEKYDASTWISLEEEAYLFAPNQTIKVPVNIQVPKDASPGGHYAQINIRGLTLERTERTGSSSIVVPELTVNVFITVSGDLKESYEVVDWEIGARHIEPGQPITTKIELKNTGNVHNLVAPVVKLLKGDELIDEYYFPPETVLPEGAKDFELEWQAPEDYGVYDVRVEAVYGTPSVILLDENRKLFVMPSILNIILVMILTWTLLYVFMHRKNLKRAVKALLQV